MKNPIKPTFAIPFKSSTTLESENIFLNPAIGDSLDKFGVIYSVLKTK